MITEPIITTMVSIEYMASAVLTVRLSSSMSSTASILATYFTIETRRPPSTRLM